MPRAARSPRPPARSTLRWLGMLARYGAPMCRDAAGCARRFRCRRFRRLGRGPPPPSPRRPGFPLPTRLARTLWRRQSGSALAPPRLPPASEPEAAAVVVEVEVKEQEEAAVAAAAATAARRASASPLRRRPSAAQTRRSPTRCAHTSGARAPRRCRSAARAAPRPLRVAAGARGPAPPPTLRRSSSPRAPPRAQDHAPDQARRRCRRRAAPCSPRRPVLRW